jgi:hypothetical protein
MHKLITTQRPQEDTTMTTTNIYPCERVPGEHRGNWIVQAYHAPTGMPYADELCRHYATRQAARDAVRGTK